MLAFAEIRRTRGRFLSIIGALSLITFLVLTLTALSDGLFYGSTGAYRSSNAQAYAFSTDAEGSLIRSRVPVSDVAAYQNVEGVTQASGIGVLLASGTGPEGELDLAVFGVEPEGAGVPTTLDQGRMPTPGEDGAAAVDQTVADRGAGIGSTIWTTIPTWRAMQASVRPETRGLPPSLSAVALELSPGTDPNSITPVTDTTVLSTEDAALAIPGVKEQRSTLNSIIYTTLLVAAIVVALFFALIVLEKRELFAALKALGTSTGRLGTTVLTQALVASVVGVIIGVAIARLLGLALPAEIPTLFRLDSLIQVSVFTVVASVLGALFSLRRIARIDPATALGGALQ